MISKLLSNIAKFLFAEENISTLGIQDYFFLRYPGLTTLQ
jgi:hypothetical protein